MCDISCGSNNQIGQAITRHEAVKYASETLCCDQKSSDAVEGVDRIEVVGEGSKIMKMVKLPTVFIRLPKGDLQESRVYYVILESEAYEFEKIPALLFSNPSNGWRTQCAELLPLLGEYGLKKPETVSLIPMLLKLRHKSMFTKGSFFKVNAIEAGRFEGPDKLPWNKWNLKLKPTRLMITEIINQDIRKMPLDMMKRLISTSKSSIVSRSRKSSSSSQCSSHTSSHTSSSLDSHFRNLSTHYPNLKFKGLTASGGSSFAKWFRHLPPDIYVDKNFRCDRGTTLRKDRFADTETFLKYLTS